MGARPRALEKLVSVGAKTLLLAGGGRWARVYLSILAELDAPLEQVLIASQHGGEALKTAIGKANARGLRRFTRVTDWRGAKADAAIVINAARDHAGTACGLLEQGLPVLVEKPVALTLAEAGTLVTEAGRRRLSLRSALMLNHCVYLRNFAEAVRDTLGPPAGIAVMWKDPPAEARYGETKSFDFGIGLAEDVGPHIASLLAAVAGPASLESADIERGGLSARLRGVCGGAALTVEMAREAPARQRWIRIRDGRGGEAMLDFSPEPGTITINGVPRDADPEWRQRLSPLTLQLLDFLRLEQRARDLDEILSTTAFVTAAAGLTRAAQRRWLVAAPGSAGDRLVAARELLAPGLIAAGLAAPGDNNALEAAAQRALAGDPALAPYL